MASGPAAIAEPQELKMVEHATTDAVTDTGAKGDSAGDILTFANEVFDADHKNKIGTNQGACFRTLPGKAWECFWKLSLEKGQQSSLFDITSRDRGEALRLGLSDATLSP
jgi:allene oxide cyclase